MTTISSKLSKKNKIQRSSICICCLCYYDYASTNFSLSFYQLNVKKLKIYNGLCFVKSLWNGILEFLSLFSVAMVIFLRVTQKRGTSNKRITLPLLLIMACSGIQPATLMWRRVQPFLGNCFELNGDKQGFINVLI